MIGAIRRVRYLGRMKEYTLTDGNLEFSFQDSRTYHQGSFVSFELDGTTPVNIKVLADEEAREAYRKIRDSVSVKEGPLLLKDEITEMLAPKLKEAAKEIVASKKCGRTVHVRFHGDADGISAAFAINSVCHLKSFQQNSAVYSVKDALRDIGNFGQDDPLILLLDFASSDQSLAGLELLKAAHIQHMIIDHHPIGRNSDVVNPFTVTENGSRYTAGYLASEIAAMAGLDVEEAMDNAKVACAGDKSGILGSDESDREKAMVLDFLAAHSSFGNNLEFYRKVMKSEELFSSILLQARESIDDASSKVAIKERSGKVRALHFSLENIVTKGEWPPSSKITTKIFEDNDTDAPLVVLGYNDRTIIIRLNDGAEKQGVSANGIAEQIKSSMGQFVEGGGGHVRAGAIRVKKGFVESVLNEIFRLIL